jgi:hypothetical protein
MTNDTLCEDKSDDERAETPVCSEYLSSMRSRGAVDVPTASFNTLGELEMMRSSHEQELTQFLADGEEGKLSAVQVIISTFQVEGFEEEKICKSIHTLALDFKRNQLTA